MSDYWLTSKPAIRIGRIAKTLVIPTFILECGEPKGCVLSRTALGGVLSCAAISIDPSDGVFIQFWAKLSIASSANYSLFRLHAASSHGWNIDITDTNGINLGMYNGASQGTSVVYDKVAYDEWNRFTIWYDETAGFVRFYINGELIGEDAALGGTPMTVGNYTLYFGDGAGQTYVNGLIDEVIIRKGTDIDHDFCLTKTGMFDITDTTNIYAYWKFSSSVYADSVNGLSLTGGIEWEADLNAPIKYGGSFVCGIIPVTLGKAVSLKFPTPVPTDPDHGMSVLWIDDEGETQRRHLYLGTGVDYLPVTLPYKGEKLNSPFRLEIWGVDGNQYAVLDEELTLQISDTTQPTTSTDVTAIEAETIAVDTTLASDSGSSFPLLFNDQQVYPS